MTEEELLRTDRRWLRIHRFYWAVVIVWMLAISAVGAWWAGKRFGVPVGAGVLGAFWLGVLHRRHIQRKRR